MIFAGMASAFEIYAVEVPDPRSVEPYDPYARKTEAIPEFNAVPKDLRPIVEVADITSYNVQTHILAVNPAAARRLRASLGKWLVVCADRKPIYVARLWKGIYSVSACHAVFMEREKRDVFAIELGYPTPDHFRGKDERSNSQIVAALSAARLIVTKPGLPATTPR